MNHDICGNVYSIGRPTPTPSRTAYNTTRNRENAIRNRVKTPPGTRDHCLGESKEWRGENGQREESIKKGEQAEKRGRREWERIEQVKKRPHRKRKEKE